MKHSHKHPYAKHFFGIILLIAIGLLFVHLYVQPRFASPSRASFISFMLVRAEHSNRSIMLERKKLLVLYVEFQDKHRLSPLSKDWLLYLCARYNVKNPNFTKDETWDELLNRVDIVPNSLVIAQAIDESDWGQSRFAQNANNYFGVWCYSPGCGLMPRQETSGPYHAVKAYPTALDSVEDYMSNLNAHGDYQAFRNARAQLRESNKPITGYALANTLTYYSERRGNYVSSIQTLIDRYDLAPYDNLAIGEEDLSIRTFINNYKAKKLAALKAKQSKTPIKVKPLIAKKIAPKHHEKSHN